MLHDLGLRGHETELKGVLLGRLRDHYERAYPAYAISHDIRLEEEEFHTRADPTDSAALPNTSSKATKTPIEDPPGSKQEAKKRRCTTNTVDDADTKGPTLGDGETRDRLCSLSARPSADELNIKLRDLDLRVLLQGLGIGRKNRGGKKIMIQAVLDWMDGKPSSPLPLPKGMLRCKQASPQSAPSHTRRPNSHSEDSGAQRKQEHSAFLRSPTAFPSRSYAAAVEGSAGGPSCAIDTTHLRAILERAQTVLQMVVDDPTRHQQSPFPLPTPPSEDLADLARCSVRELQAARAGLEAAAALAPNGPSSIRPNPPSLPSHSAKAWIHERCIVLDPPDDRQRRLASDFPRMGRAVDQALRTALAIPSGPLVDMLRRTRRGGYCAQLFPTHSSQARRLSSLKLQDGSIWQCSPLTQSPNMPTCGSTGPRSSRIRRDSFIVGGVPDSIPDSDLLKAFASSNASRFGYSPGQLMARLQSAH